MTWTADMDAMLRSLAADGALARDIAAALGPGVTKNAVIGRAWRTGVPLSNAGEAAQRAYRHARSERLSQAAA